MRHDKLLSEMVAEINPTTNASTEESTSGITVNDLNAMADRLSQTMDKKIYEAIEKAYKGKTSHAKHDAIVDAAAAAEPETVENEEDNNQED